MKMSWALNYRILFLLFNLVEILLALEFCAIFFGGEWILQIFVFLRFLIARETEIGCCVDTKIKIEPLC